MIRSPRFTNLINLTPHDLTIYCDPVIHGLKDITVRRDGSVARVDVSDVKTTPACVVYSDGTYAVIPCYVRGNTSDGISGLPAPVEGNLFIVSNMVREAVNRISEREDVCSPGELVRDNDGNVIACRGLIF